MIYMCVCVRVRTPSLCIDIVYIYICASPQKESTFDALLETYMVKLTAHFN